MESFKKLLQSPRSEDDTEAEDVVQLPGMVPPLQVDTQQCTMVVIMPRSHPAGGMVDHKQTVEKPWTKANRIFNMPNNQDSEKTLSKFDYINSSDEPMRMEVYQADIRQRFLEILADSGVQVDHFASLDEDETFLKLYLPLDGDCIAKMAEHLEYDMPVRESVYADVKKHGPYDGETPLTNMDGRVVFAHTKFRVAEKEKFKKFRAIDSIRLLEFWLDEWVSLDEMERQGVITCYYPCPSSTQILEIHQEVLSPVKWFSPSFGQGSLKIRPYLGEQLAFYFKFVAHLAQSMLVPGVVGVLFLVGGHSFMKERHVGICRSVLCVLISIWAATLLQLFARHTSRTKQYWGVQEHEAFEQPNPDWDSSRTGEAAKIFVNAATVAYVGAYVGGITALLTWQYNLDSESYLTSISSILLTFVIKGGNFLWTSIAPKLVQLENHRTETDQEEKLSALLAGVKLFVANFPFFSHCFLTNYVQAECGATFEEAARASWPSFDESLLNAETKKVLRKFSFRKGREICINGCIPTDYAHAEFWSETNCDADVRSNLTTYFAFAVAIEIVFLILPILLSYWEIHKEYKKMQSKDSDDEENGEELKTYSFLQWEAKKFPYAYGSWGGDKVNDFLDMAINYSIVACWGVLYPPMATVAAIALFLLLRLRVYRMLYVTRRPLPRASAGLGIWRTIFQCINVAAVACNVGLAATFFYPMRQKSFGVQLLLFLVLEHAILILQATVRFLISESPTDVTKIMYYNEFVKKSMHKSRAVPMKRTSVGHVNVSLNPDNIQSEGESDSS